MPDEIKVLERADDRRFRLTHSLTISWRYAPGGAGFGEFVESRTSHISEVGLALWMPRHLRAGSQIEIILDLSDRAPFSVIGSLTAASLQPERSNLYLADVKFDNLTPKNADILHDFTARANETFMHAACVNLLWDGRQSADTLHGPNPGPGRPDGCADVERHEAQTTAAT